MIVSSATLIKFIDYISSSGLRSNWLVFYRNSLSKWEELCVRVRK